MRGTVETTLYEKKSRRSPIALLGIILIVVLLASYFLAVMYPLFWMVMSSFKVTNEIYASSWSLPTEWMFSNYSKAWTMGVSKYFMNSVLVTVTSVVLTVTFSAFSAYGLSRFSFKGKYVILALLSAGLMFSPQVSLIPLYGLVQDMGIHDTPWSLIFPYVAFRTSMTVLLIRSFFLQVPKELEESAYLEGCSSLGVMLRIFVPLSKPIILTTVMITSYWTWNEFLFATIFIDSDVVKTITVGLLAFRDALYTDWGVLMAGLVISALPLVMLFVFMQKHFVRALGEGGVKG